MAIPAVGNLVTPANFLAVAAQGQVALSWSAVPLSTIYYISRSDDNVTFAELGTSTSLTYNDTSGTVDQVYYYYVQAGTATASSPATTSQASLSLKPGQTTVANLRLECQQRTDRVYSDNITDQEWNSMISRSYKELYDILAQKFGDTYFSATPYTYTTVQNLQSYPLPDDFYKLLGVDIALNPSDPNSWVSLTQFNFVQRNLYNYPNQYTLYGITNLRYRLNGNDLYVVPIPQQGQTLRVWYVPRPDELIDDTDIVDGVSGWEEYIVADVCIKALAKTEEDASIFGAQKMALMKRIEEAAENRNIGEPNTVSDSRRRNFSWTSGSGAGGWD